METALDKLKRMTAWDIEPELGEDDLDAILAECAVADAAGLRPTGEDWDPTYDMNAAAAKGWLVFQPNYRGSDNLGGEFQRAIQGDAGAGPGRDVMAGIEMIKKRGIVDESKMAVSGWSYGGYMTSWLIGNYPNEWKAAMAGAPVASSSSGGSTVPSGMCCWAARGCLRCRRSRRISASRSSRPWLRVRPR